MTVFRAHEQWANFFRKSWLISQRWPGQVSLTVAIVFFAGGLLALLASYRTAGMAARRKLHVIVVGSGAGFLKPLDTHSLGEFFPGDVFQTAKAYIGAAMQFTLPLIPLSFAYAIIKHKVIPVSLIIGVACAICWSRAGRRCW
jgi:hypothetical protein